MKNRSRYEVIAAILKSAGREETRTKIMHKAMLSKWPVQDLSRLSFAYGLIQGSNSEIKWYIELLKKGTNSSSYYDQMRLLFPIVVEENFEEGYYHLNT